MGRIIRTEVRAFSGIVKAHGSLLVASLLGLHLAVSLVPSQSSAQIASTATSPNTLSNEWVDRSTLNPATSSHQAQLRVRGFLEVRAKHLYLDYIVADPGAPTLVLLNGLTYSTSSWDRFVSQLGGHGYGVLRYDPDGMGQTFDHTGIPASAILHDEQVQDLHELLSGLKLSKNLILVGLSYGGAIGTEYAAKFPNEVDHLIAIAPYTEPLQTQDETIRFWIAQTRFAQPWNSASDDELYDFFLRQIIWSTYHVAEPSILTRPFLQEAIFRMVQGIRKFLPVSVTPSLPAHSMHLVVAMNDEYITDSAVLERFWNQVPKVKRGSRLFVENTKHKVPETKPEFLAKWIGAIVNQPNTYQQGITFQGSTFESVREVQGAQAP